MADETKPSLKRGDIIYKLAYIATFNDVVWNAIFNVAGNKIYWGGNKDVTLGDYLTKVSYDDDGVPQDDGHTNIKLSSIPKWTNYTAYTGENTTTGSVKSRYKYNNAGEPLSLESQPFEAIPSVHLRTKAFDNVSNIDNGTNLGFILTENSIDNKAVEIGTEKGTAEGQAKGLSGEELDAYVEQYVNDFKKLLVADVLYEVCLELINKLVYIRPFSATWYHDYTERVKRSGEGKKYKYGKTKTHIERMSGHALFKDNPQINTARERRYLTNDTWASTMGGNVKTLEITEASVSRVGLNKIDISDATATGNVIANYWTAWSTRCLKSNKFEYRYYSCHLSCHSSCHNSCHGSRSRR